MEVSLKGEAQRRQSATSVIDTIMSQGPKYGQEMVFVAHLEWFLVSLRSAEFLGTKG